MVIHHIPKCEGLASTTSRVTGSSLKMVFFYHNSSITYKFSKNGLFFDHNSSITYL